MGGLKRYDLIKKSAFEQNIGEEAQRTLSNTLPLERGVTQLLDTIENTDASHVYHGDTIPADTFVALVESRPFLRECIARSMQSAFSVPVVTFSTLSELGGNNRDASPALVILSLILASREAWLNALNDLSEGGSHRPVVTLASTNDIDLARAAIRHGAKGYIPVTMGFDIAVEAIRFVLVGGTYAPTDYLLTTDQLGLLPLKAVQQPVGNLTSREISVVKAIKQGKSNKVIAHELAMCESTVKVHVRNVMKKLNAKNRTEVAMKA